MTERLRVTVLISGRGSNMVAIARACRDGRIPAAVTAVVSDKAEAGGLSLARDLGIETCVVQPPRGMDRGAYGEALAAVVGATRPGLVVLAGFMRILDPVFTRRFEGRLFNIHPSLLPKYPGLHTHRRVLEAGDATHGCTVHFVNDELDAGPPIVQAAVPVLPGDDEAVLSARVQRWEHIVYPESVGWFATGRLELRGGAAWLDGRRLDEPVMRGEA
jgi:phosphoribosylglycinamide formyltransferase-1